ncbi:MAG: hypothetical protein ACP6IY_13710 [Promethearchaeia archaeon]
MRPSRIFRTIVRLFLLVLTLSMSVVSFLGGYSAILILSDSDNIAIPDGNINYYLNVTDPDTSKLFLDLPYKVRNAGYFDLDDLSIEVKVYYTFHDTNKTNNATTTLLLAEKKQTFDTIKAGETDKGNFSMKYEDFTNLEEVQNRSVYMDTTKSPMVIYTADIIISAKYSLRLLSFTVTLKNITIGEET